MIGKIIKLNVLFRVSKTVGWFADKCFGAIDLACKLEVAVQAYHEKILDRCMELTNEILEARGAILVDVEFMKGVISGKETPYRVTQVGGGRFVLRAGDEILLRSFQSEKGVEVFKFDNITLRQIVK